MLEQSRLGEEDRVLLISAKLHASKTIYKSPSLATETFDFLMICKQT
jgi:hypothetical protein